VWGGYSGVTNKTLMEFKKKKEGGRERNKGIFKQPGTVTIA